MQQLMAEWSQEEEEAALYHVIAHYQLPRELRLEALQILLQISPKNDLSTGLQNERQ